jgi:hypothetical protein
MEITKISDLIDNYPTGQKRCGKSKQFVFIVDDYVYKGPYSNHDTVALIKFRSDTFESWSTPLVVLVHDIISLEDDVNITKHENAEFIRYPNLLQSSEYKTETYTESFGSKIRHQMIIKSDLISLNKYLEKDDLDYDDDQIHNLILGLAHMYILNVGDMHLRNILINTQTKQLYIIDYDAKAQDDKVDSNTFYFRMSPRKDINWYSNVKKWYPIVAEELKSLLSDSIIKKKKLESRLKLTISLFEKYGSDTSQTKDKKSKKETKETDETKVVNVKVKYLRPEYDNLEEWMNNDNNVYIGRKSIVFINKVRFPKKDSIWCNPFKINKGNDRDEVCKKYRKHIIAKLDSDPKLVNQLLKLKGCNLGCWCAPEPCHGDILIELINQYDTKDNNNDVESIIEEDEHITKDKVSTKKELPGGMKVSGMNRSTGYSGYSTGINKSALQKYVRRNMVEKALKSGFELFAFKSYVAGIVTNLYNRLSVIALEDIGIANPNLAITVVKYINDIRGLSTDITYSDVNEGAMLGTIIQLLCESYKTRNIGWYSYAYSAKIDLLNEAGLNINVDQEPQPITSKSELKKIFSREDDEILVKYATLLNEALIDHNPIAFTWFDLFWKRCYCISPFDDEDKPECKSRIKYGNKRGSKDPLMILWSVLALHLDQEIIEILGTAYFDSDKRLKQKIKKRLTPCDSKLYPGFIILLIIKNIINPKLLNLKNLSLRWEKDETLDTLINLDYEEYEVDSYVVDKHTNEGKSKGKGIKEWISEGGTLVIPEAVELRDELLIAIYNART